MNIYLGERSRLFTFTPWSWPFLSIQRSHSDESGRDQYKSLDHDSSVKYGRCIIFGYHFTWAILVSRILTSKSKWLGLCTPCGSLCTRTPYGSSMSQINDSHHDLTQYQHMIRHESLSDLYPLTIIPHGWVRSTMICPFPQGSGSLVYITIYSLKEACHTWPWSHHKRHKHKPESNHTSVILCLILLDLVPSLIMDNSAPLANTFIKSYHILPVLIRSLHGPHQSSLPFISHETDSLLHPPSRLSWPLKVESGLLSSLMNLYVCYKAVEEA